MPTISVAVEDNGWILAVRGTWGATSGAWTNNGASNSFDRPDAEFQSGGANQFPLDPNGTPKIVVSVTSPGYTWNGSAAVAGSQSRTLIATRPLRKPYPDYEQLDETDHGDGTRTIRFALSERVFSTDTLNSVTLLSGWKVGQGAATITGGDLTNSSTRTPPLPVMRAAVPPYRLVRGATSVHCDWVVAAHYPSTAAGTRHHPLAGLKVEATDGTNTVTTWLTGLQTSPLYNDNLRCVGGTVNLSGLTAGVVTLIATAYPWVGASRTIGSGHVTDVAAPFAISAEEPLTVCYDPSSDRYPVKHIYVDPVSGTTTAASVTVADDLATAKAGTASADVSTAVQALYLANLSLAAGKGQSAKTRAADWCVITLAAGASTWGATAVTSGFTGGNEGAIVVQGDPDDANPRANCILRSGTTANPLMRNNRWWFRDLTVEAGEQTWLSANMQFAERVTVRGKTGFESATTPVFYAATNSGTWNAALLDVKWTNYGTGLSGSAQRGGLLRNVEHPMTMQALAHVNVTRGATPAEATYPWITPQSIATSKMSDLVVWNCTGKRLGNNAISAWPYLTGDDTDASPRTVVRTAIVNTLFEHSGANGSPFWMMGELSYIQMQDSVFDSNTYVGQRVNFHNNPTPVLINLHHTNNVARNEYHDWQATKHDMFTSNGISVGGWEWSCGVGKSGLAFGYRVPGAPALNFNHMFAGLNAALDTSYTGAGSNAWPKFTDDNSQAGPDGDTSTGNGDYRPAAGSPLLARGSVSTVDQFADGTAKGASFPTGARAMPFEQAVVQPSLASHALSDTTIILRGMRTLGPVDSWHVMEAEAGKVMMTGMTRRGRSIRTALAGGSDRQFRVGLE